MRHLSLDIALCGLGLVRRSSSRRLTGGRRLGCLVLCGFFLVTANSAGSGRVIRRARQSLNLLDQLCQLLVRLQASKLCVPQR